MTDMANRLGYHFCAEGGVGRPRIFYWAGKYHLYFEHRTAGPDGRSAMEIAQAISEDMIRWRQFSPAMAPGPDDYDSAGIRIGSIVERGGEFYCYYTGSGGQGRPGPSQCLAVSGDLENWRKHPGNPIISEIPAGYGPAFRDPFVWQDGRTWRMIVGSQFGAGRGGAGLLYESQDLISWQYVGPFCEAHVNDAGKLFECPDFSPNSSTGCLLTSCGRTYWHGGPYLDGMFLPEKGGLVDGGEFYFGRATSAGDGMRILWGQIGENRRVIPGPSGNESSALAGCGILSLPRVIQVGRDGLPKISPAGGLTSLRGRHTRFENLEISDSFLPLKGIDAGRLEATVVFDRIGAEEIGIEVGTSPDGGNASEKELEKICRISLRPQEGFFEDLPLNFKNNQQLVLRVYIDGPVVEAFANDCACMTYLSASKNPGAVGISIFALGGAVIIKTADIWEISSG